MAIFIWKASILAMEMLEFCFLRATAVAAGTAESAY